MKSIFGISQLGVAPAFPMPVYDNPNYFELGEVPQDRTLVLKPDTVELKSTIVHSQAPKKIIPERSMSSHLDSLCTKVGSKIAKIVRR